MPVLAAASVIALAGAANAAPAPAQTWDGFYVAGVVGAQATDAGFSLPGDANDALLQTHNSHTAFSGGGIVGFNHQMDNWVVGVEGDVVDGDNTQSVTDCTVPDGCWTPTHDSFTTFNHLHEGVNGHLRVRLGYATGRTLFYVAGGYSVADTRLDLVGNCYNPGSPSTPLLFNYSRSKVDSGFNIGAGVERAVGAHVTLRAEYVFDDFGKELYKGDGAEWNDRRIDVQNSNFRVAAAYKF
jgi:outer membrane immunogenic protein